MTELQEFTPGQIRAKEVVERMLRPQEIGDMTVAAAQNGNRPKYAELAIEESRVYTLNPDHNPYLQD